MRNGIDLRRLPQEHVVTCTVSIACIQSVARGVWWLSYAVLPGPNPSPTALIPNSCQVDLSAQSAQLTN